MLVGMFGYKAGNWLSEQVQEFGSGLGEGYSSAMSADHMLKMMEHNQHFFDVLDKTGNIKVALSAIGVSNEIIGNIPSEL